MKIIAIIYIFFMFQFCPAQDKIPTEEEAQIYFKNALREELVYINYFMEDGELYDFYSTKKPGEIIITGTEVYQVEGTKSLTVYNYSIIIFDKSKQDIDNVKKLQNSIISKYNFGVSFRELSEKYSTPQFVADDVSLDYEGIEDGPLKTGIDTHKPGEMFLVEFTEGYSYLMVINSPPVIQKAVVVKQAVKKF